MNRVIEERVDTLTSAIKADADELRAQLSRRREDNQTIQRERDALLAETKALRHQAEARVSTRSTRTRSFVHSIERERRYLFLKPFFLFKLN